MNDHNKSMEIENIACETCLKEVPHSETQITEVDDYVMNFCGLDCYEKWSEAETNKE